jgi:hypothetical protein
LFFFFFLKPREGGNELRRRFVSDVLERLVRLAYYERIRPTIPEDFVELMPTKPSPTYKYDDEMVSVKGNMKQKRKR